MHYTIKELKIVLICVLVMIFTIILTSFSYDNKQTSKIKEFNNGKTLICFETLIVTNSNWKLVSDQLININSAGYIKIKNCEVK